jgi:DNA-directed RNA polymerase subunit L
MNERKTTSFKIDPPIWDKFKIYAIQKKIDMSELLEKMIEKELKKNGE